MFLFTVFSLFSALYCALCRVMYSLIGVDVLPATFKPYLETLFSFPFPYCPFYVFISLPVFLGWPDIG